MYQTKDTICMDYKNRCWWLKFEFITIGWIYWPGGNKNINDSVTKVAAGSIIMIGTKQFWYTQAIYQTWLHFKVVSFLFIALSNFSFISYLFLIYFQIWKHISGELILTNIINTISQMLLITLSQTYFCKQNWARRLIVTHSESVIILLNVDYTWAW